METALLNVNDYRILQAIILPQSNSKTDAKRRIMAGNTILNGKTKAEIMEITQLGRTKVNLTIKRLIELGFIAEGLMKARSKTFYMTQSGKRELKRVKTPPSEINMYKEKGEIDNG